MDRLYPGQRLQSAVSPGSHPPHPPLCRLSLAVMLAALGLPMEGALADACISRTTVLTGTSQAACVLDGGEQLQVQTGAELNVPGGPAVMVNEGTTARQVLNNGVISGQTGLLVNNARLAGTVFNARTGQVTGTEAAVHIRNSTIGTLANAGSLSLSGGPGVDLPAVTIENSTVNGDINNAGTIEVVNDSGYSALVIDGSRVKGNIKNSGAINGYYYGLIIGNSTVDGSFHNSGTIFAGSAVGVYNTTIGHDFINSGEVTSTFALTNVTIKGNFINTGVIDGGDFAYIRDSHISGDVINTGTITAASGTGIGADIEGRLVNTGILSGEARPFGISGNIRGGLYNSGSITGGGDFSTGATLSAQAPVVVNSGTISGLSGGLFISDDARIGTLINSGTISRYADFSGSETSLEISEAAQVGSVQIAGNHARFDGRVEAPTVPFFVNPGASYRFIANDVMAVRSLTNQGTLVLAAPVDNAAAPATIVGNFSQAADGVLRTEVLDATHYGQLAVTGTATLPAQARIEVDVAQASQPLSLSRLQDVLSAGTLVSNGTFAVTSNSALFGFSAVKDGNTVDLLPVARSNRGVQAAVQAAGLGDTIAAAAVVDAQLAKGSNSALTPLFATATDNREVAAALAASLPTGNHAVRASQSALASINRLVDQRLAGFAPGALGGQALAPFWAEPFNFSSVSRGQSEQAQGTVIGTDTRLANGNHVGFAFAYAQGEATAQAASAQGSSLDLWQFMAYGSQALDERTDVHVYAGAGNNRVRTERDFAIAGTAGAASADYNAMIATVGARLGQTLAISEATQFRPSLRLDYNHVHEGAYRERGTAALQPLLLRVDERDSDQLVLGLDGAMEHALTPLAHLRLGLGVGYDLLDQPSATTAAYAAAPGERFTVTSSGSNPWEVTGSLGLVARWRNGNEVSVSHEAQQRGDFSDQVTALKVVMPF